MGRIVINETENKQTVILNDSPAGVEGGYFDATMNWHEMGSGGGGSAVSIPLIKGSITNVYSSSYWDSTSNIRGGSKYFYNVKPQTGYKLTIPENETTDVSVNFYTYANMDSLYTHSNMSEVANSGWLSYTDIVEFTTPENCQYIRLALKKGDNQSIGTLDVTAVLEEV